MALCEKDIFDAVFARYKDQPIEFVMEQYEKALKINLAIENRLVQTPVAQCEVPEAPAAPAEEAPKKKKYTKRSLKVKPEEAIQEDFITCCICGEQKTLLTAAHFAHHGITPEEYRKLCGYDPKQPLMSKKREEFSKTIIARAQAARKAKKEAQQ